MRAPRRCRSSSWTWTGLLLLTNLALLMSWVSGVFTNNEHRSIRARMGAGDAPEVFGNIDLGRKTLLETQGDTVWLYSLINTDSGGPSMIPHFVHHYSRLGILSNNIVVDLLHTPTLPDDGLLDALEQFRRHGIACRTILQPYSPNIQDQAMISALSQLPVLPEDWIVVADLDELFTFGPAQDIRTAIQLMDAEGATYASGNIVDHVSTTGSLAKLQDGIKIWEQFPMSCPMTATIARGSTTKVTLHKAFLRSGAGHHQIVEPYLARAYFGSDCAGPLCELVLKLYKQRSAIDVYELTPYFRYADHYTLGNASSGASFHARAWSVQSTVHHFKWRYGLLDILSARVRSESGNCLLNVNEARCQPVFQFWKESARLLISLNGTQRIDLRQLKCKAPL